MFILDINGRKLELTETHIKETPGNRISKYPYRILLSDLRKRWKRDAAYGITCSGRDGLGYPHKVRITAIKAIRNIGCHAFGVKTFNKILKAAGIRVPKTSTRRVS